MSEQDPFAPETEQGDAALDEWLAYQPPPRRIRRGVNPRDPLVLAAAVLALATLAGMFLLRPTGEARGQADRLTALGVPSEFHAAEVVTAETQPCVGVPTQSCLHVEFELLDGPDAGFVYEQDFFPGRLTPEFAEGDRAILSRRSPAGVVDDATTGPCSFDPDTDCRTLHLLIDTGEGLATPTDWELFPGDIAGGLAIGDDVLIEFVLGDDDAVEVLGVSPADPALLYQFADFQRRGTLLWVALAFAAVVVALGGLRGFAALAGLAASVVVLLLFVLPAILDGRSPVLVAVIGAAAIAFLALYLAHGFNRMTTVALLGTLGALTLTALLSAIVVAIARFSGFASEESTLLTLFEGVDVQGLLLAGIVLGAAGAIDDVTVTQASAVWELKATDPKLSPHQLFTRGLRIGRDHIASTVNTLLLAYAGASLPLLVLFVLSNQSLGTIANSEVVAVEIVRTLVGSIGLVAAVPFTTWLAAHNAEGRRLEGAHGHT